MPVPMICFNDVAEWLEELGRSPEPRVVRVTIRREQVGVGMPLLHYHLLAGYVDDDGRLVELALYLGEAMTGDRSAKVFDAIEERRGALTASIKDFGHVVRSGRFRLEQRP